MSTIKNLNPIKRLKFDSPQLIGVLIFLLGTVVLSGWVLGIESLVRIVPGSVAMGVNAAIMFLASGLCLMRWTPTSRTPIHINLSIALLILLPILVALEHIIDVSLGIDLTDLHAQVRDGNPRPGRVAPNTILAFFLSGWAFFLISRTGIKNLRFVISGIAIVIGLIGFTALLGYLLRLEAMYQVASLNRMAAPTAIGMMLLSFGLWSQFRQKFPRPIETFEHEDKRIKRVAAMVMIMLAIAVALSSFAVLRHGFEKSLAERTHLMAQNHASLIAHTIKEALLRAKSASLRPTLQGYLTALNIDPTRDDLRALIVPIGKSLLQFEFSGLRFYNVRGDLIVSAGPMITDKPAVSVALTLSNEKAWLVWHNGFLLRTENNVIHDGQHVGSIVAEQRLTELDALVASFQQSGDSQNALLCGRKLNNAVCFPARFYAANTLIPMFNSYGEPNLPISRALLGESGAYTLVDFRKISVLAGFAPISTFNLGLSIQADLREMYSPLRKRLQVLLGLLLVFVAIATYMLRKQLHPLLIRIVSEERRMKGILENSHDAFVAIDHEGRVSDWNTQAERTFGWTRNDAMGKNLASLIIPPEQQDAHNRGFERYLKSGTGPVINNRIEVTALHSSGKIIPIELSIAPFHDGQHFLANAFLRDISDRKRAEQALFSEKEHLRVTLSSIGDAVITTDIAGRVTYLNPIAEKMTGWSNAAAVGRPLPSVFDIRNEKTRIVVPNPVEYVLKHDEIATLAIDTILLRHGGGEFPIEDSAAPIRDAHGVTIGVVLVFHDVTHARGMASQMSYQATHDPLTGLINRREFERRLEVALQTGKHEGKQHALLYLDLDQFKIVNDTCGHTAGDELLRQLTSILQSKLRQSDTLARLGGDEFGVLLESCAIEPALRIAEILRQTVRDFHFIWIDKTFTIGVSIGVVSFSNGGVTLSDIFQMADESCYVAKDKGRNRVQVYTPEDKELTQRRGEMGWVSRIQEALDENRFVLYSQKILPLAVNHSPNEDNHYEVLIRMIDREGAIVPPMAFIPAAERYGLMTLIDRRVIETVFAHYHERHPPGSPVGTCAINLSGASISNEHLFEYVRDMIEHYRIPPNGICFEITETSAIANLARAMSLIRKLKDLGCRFSLDDFGSGMSSFAYLKHLSVDYLKIDGGFVKDMIQDSTDRAMVEAINHIGHVMGIQTVAEFVENEEILQVIRNIGIDFAQGYGIERPKPMCK